jgi:5,5'-dehydrodivanillate O-demethylase
MAVAQRDARLQRARRTPRRRWDINLAETGPGTPGGIFLRQFWHAIGRSADLSPGRAMPIRILSEDFTLYRGHSGKAQIMAAHCAHRGAQLFLGWVEGDDLRCVYHGWKYDCTGQCIETPAEEPGFGAKVRVRSYPTAEAFGLIYGYFGEGQPPEFPPYPESHGEGYIDPWPVERVPCNYLQSFENSMDEVHVAFTHAPGGSHAKLAADLPIITAEETDWGIMRYGARADGTVRHTLHYAPCIVRVIVPPLQGMDGIGGWPEITFHMTPVDDHNHLWIISAKVLVTGQEAERYRQKREEFEARKAARNDILPTVEALWAGRLAYADVRHEELVVIQDIAVQAGQGRITDREHEHLGRSDRGLILWRHILARELRLIAEGRPHKKWTRPPADVIPVVGANIPRTG